MGQQLPQRPAAKIGFTVAGDDQRVFRHEFTHDLPAGATGGQCFKSGGKDKDGMRCTWRHAGRNRSGERVALRTLGQTIGRIFHVTAGIDVAAVIHDAGAHPGAAVG